ncbi:hypothetical protein Ddc_06497 [Ditylenchus destructor]|nr:hypothetical protein Ddc_06497 [Ditylenchus destructor]
MHKKRSKKPLDSEAIPKLVPTQPFVKHPEHATFSPEGEIIESVRRKRKKRAKKPLDSEVNPKLVPTQPFVKESEMPASFYDADAKTKISADGETIESSRPKRKKRAKKPMDSEKNPKLVPTQPFVKQPERAIFSADGEIIESGTSMHKKRSKKPLDSEAIPKHVLTQPFVKQQERAICSADGEIVESVRPKRKKRAKKPMDSEAIPKVCVCFIDENLIGATDSLFFVTDLALALCACR